jgi:polyhydroxyalkanoate synthesis regulator phasin
MEDLFKKFVNAGVGFLSQGNKKVQSTIDKLVQESKISEQEGKQIVDELMKSSDTKLKELEAQFKGLTDTVMKTVGMGGKEKKATKSGASKPATSKAAGSKAGASGAAKTANSAASKGAGTVKKFADDVSKTASTAQRSAAAKAGAAKKPAAKKAAPASQDGAANAEGQND